MGRFASKELIEALRVHHVSVILRIGSQFELKLLPDPPLFLRWFVPALRHVAMKA